MKCLITGVAGFIGSTLSEQLLNLGHKVVGIDCFTDYYPRSIKEANLAASLKSPDFHFIEADMLRIDLSPIIKKTDWVFHQAAQPGVRGSWGSNFSTYTRNNILATQYILEAAKDSKIKRLVYASSSSVYGDAPELPLSETSRPQPVSPYGVTKLAAEHLCYLYYANYKIPTVSLRYFTVYGPRQRPDMGFHKFIKAALQGEEITIFGDGEQTRDFTYISDAVAANILAAETAGVEGRIFNIGGGSRISVNNVLKILRRLAGDIKVKRIENQKGDVRHTMSDTTAVREALGYSPKVGIEAGLQAEFEWLKQLCILD